MTMYIQWGLGCGLLLLFLWLSFLNACVFWNRHVLGKETPSWIPLLGGGSGMIACWVVPIAILRNWWWLPLVLDWGCLPGITYSIIYHLIKRLRK